MAVPPNMGAINHEARAASSLSYETIKIRRLRGVGGTTSGIKKPADAKRSLNSVECHTAVTAGPMLLKPGRSGSSRPFMRAVIPLPMTHAPPEKLSLRSVLAHVQKAGTHPSHPMLR